MPKKPTRSSKRNDTKKPSTHKEEDIELITLSSRFKFVFVTVTGITVLSLLAYIALAIIYPETDPGSNINDVLGTLKYTSTSGFGAIVGLMGGKAL